MRFRIIVVLLLFAIGGCQSERTAPNVIDLTKRLSFAEKSDDIEILFFGTPDSKRFLPSGWSRADKYEDETFQWGVSENSSFSFETRRIEPLFLHIKLGSFFPNSAQVFLNKHPVGTIQIKVEPELYSLELPVHALKTGTNHVGIHWKELRQPPRPKDSPKLSAVAYFAAITPAKYLSGNLSTELQKSIGRKSMVQVSGKSRSSLMLNLGGTIRFYEKLNKDSRLEFGILFDPAAVSEKDDFADFSVSLQRDGNSEKTIFHKRANQELTTRETVSLSKYINSIEPEVYEIEFKIRRNSILDSGKTAWIEPALYQGSSEKSKHIDESTDRLREANKNANVIVIILDAAGAKHLQTYGYQRKTTPNIEKLVQEGAQFEKAYCQAVYTLASTASLMSGLDPYRHHVIERDAKLPEKIVTLAERFSNSGYATGTFVANGNASATYGMTQGFQEVREVYREPNYTGWGSDITNRFTQWLDGLDPNRPFFVYIHYREPHGPFNPPQQFKNHFTDPNYTRYEEASDEMRKKITMGEISATQEDRDFITASYDENLRYGDYEVGRLINKLKQLNRYERTIILITADHGEAFWEHDFQGHNSQLYEESVRIPLIVKLSSASGIRGKRVSTPIGTVDIYPSLVDLLKLSRKNWDVDGRSFLPNLVSTKIDEAPILSQTINEQAYSCAEGNYKYIYHRLSGEEELYDLKNDPTERMNLIKTQLIQAAYLRSRLVGWRETNSEPVATQ